MRRLHYAGSYMLTSDRTCKAVLRYARALSEHGHSDVVTVPVLDEGGSFGFAHLLIGPASELYSTPVESEVEPPEDEESVANLENRTKVLQPDRPAWPLEMTDIGDIDDLHDLLE